MEEACDKAKKKSSNVQFRLGYATVCYGNRLISLLDDTREILPTTEILLDKCDPEEGVVERLQTGKLDMALFPNPYGELPEEIRYIEFGWIPHVALVYEGHRLEGQTGITKDDFKQSEILACEGMRKIESSLTEDAFEDYDNKGILLKDIDSVFAMIRAKRGVACLPVLEDVEWNQIKKLPLVDELYEQFGPKLVLAWSERADDMVCEELIPLFKQYYSKN